MILRLVLVVFHVYEYVPSELAYLFLLFYISYLISQLGLNTIAE